MEFQKYANLAVVQEMAFAVTLETLQKKTGITTEEFKELMATNNKFYEKFFDEVAETVKESFEIFKEQKII
ncbi:TPA: hypothetical protein ACFP4A_001197 [Neisseria subflava]